MTQSKTNFLTISATSACKHNKVDLKFVSFIANTVNSTNGAYATMNGGINKANISCYSNKIASSISKMLMDGLSYDDIIKKEFIDF